MLELSLFANRAVVSGIADSAQNQVTAEHDQANYVHTSYTQLKFARERFTSTIGPLRLLTGDAEVAHTR